MTEAIQESVLWIYKMIITFVIAVVVIGIVGVTVKNEVNTIDLQRNLFVTRILYSPDSFWYVDEQGIVYPGIIDESKFTQERMQQNFQYPAPYGGANITLTYGAQKKAIFANSDGYTYYRRQVDAGLLDETSIHVRHYPVSVRIQGQEVRGVLRVEVAMPLKA